MCGAWRRLSDQTVLAFREEWSSGGRDRVARQARLIMRLLWADFGGYTNICNAAIKFVVGENISASKCVEPGCCGCG